MYLENVKCSEGTKKAKITKNFGNNKDFSLLGCIINVKEISERQAQKGKRDGLRRK